MVLNIFPRKKEPAEPATQVTPEALPEPSPEALEEAPRRPARRGTRGGRGRSRAAGTVETPEATEAPQVEPGPAEPVSESPEPAADGQEPAAAPARSRSRRSRKPAAQDPAAAEAEAPAAEAPAPAPRGRRNARPAVDTVAREEPPARQPRAPREERPARQPRAERKEESADEGSASILRAIDLQNQQIERLIQLQEDMARRVGSGASITAPPARVGIFVDAANVELASDRLRARFDWAKILRLLTENRQLVRAIAYSPVHDDPGVSMETQRFVEPFLDKGYKVVTKPLKRFQDGTIKANVDIELALDVITMLDRLDVVCLVSGDGDFQRLVEVVQSHGVRVEVVAVGASTAGNLRNAADKYIDLQTRLREVRL
ncbi:MAG TPA: NYN domain-containing protein [Tepidiformaceae bacterium]